jgi:predicted phosphodiesterase
MKILVISDSHGNIANLKHVMGFAKNIKAGGVIHCGDWNNVAAAKTVIFSGIPLYSVLGNADIDPELDKYLSKQSTKFTQNYLKIKLGGKKIGLVHIFNSYKRDLRKLDIVFSGHYSNQSIGEHTDTDGFSYRVVQPGSLENNINFAIYDTKTDKVELIHE